MVAPFIPTNEAHSYDVTGNDQEAMRWVDSDGSGTGQILRLTNRYLWADSVDQLLSDEQYWNNTGMAINATTSSTVAGNTLWTRGDHLGSIRDLLDNNGVIREHQVFDSYGRLVREVDYNSAGQVIASNDAWAVDTVFGYTGRSWDTDVNLQYNRARWYDPQTGRWLSQDPIGFAAGDENLYRYVGNGPTNATDPSGLQGVGHHWVPMNVALKLLEHNIITLDEYKYFLGMSSGDCNHRGSHPTYDAAVENEVRKWKSLPKKKSLTIDQFLDRIREGQGVDGKRVSEIDSFLETKIRPYFPKGSDGKYIYDPKFNSGTPEDVCKRGRRQGVARKHPVTELENLHGLGLAGSALGLLAFAGQGAESVGLISDSYALKYAERNARNLDVLENCLIGTGPGNGHMSLAAELEVKGHKLLGHSIRAAVKIRLEILRSQQSLQNE